ncbi:MAG: helix-turn-helix domain-containing protein, partial [Asticcacaulis sp.]
MQELKSRPDKDTRREAILDVASRIFLEEGFDAASMSAIAARVGGSKGTLYNYFKNKEELFEAFVDRHCVLHAALID